MGLTMLHQRSTRRKPSKLLLLLLLSIVAVLIVTGCHVHLAGETPGSDAHCSLCQLATGFVAVIIFLLALLRSRTIHAFCPVATPAYRSLATRWLYIRPPPATFAA